MKTRGGTAPHGRRAYPKHDVEGRIFMIRGRKVLLSTDLAELYQVEVRALVQAVKRNTERFPPDFMFQVSAAEFAILKSQIVISSWGGSRRAAPYAFTEQGIAMLSGVLHGPKAIEINIEIMRAFVRMRNFLESHQDLAAKLGDLERRHEHKFEIVFEAIRQLSSPEPPKRRKIGFETG